MPGSLKMIPVHIACLLLAVCSALSCSQAVDEAAQQPANAATPLATEHFDHLRTVISLRHRQDIDAFERFRWYFTTHNLDPNGRTSEGLPLLSICARQNLRQYAEFLISQGADIDARESVMSVAPIHRAAQEGHNDFVAYLLELRADPNTGIGETSTPLYLAIFNGHFETADLLIAHGAKVTAQEREGTLDTLTPTYAIPLHAVAGELKSE